MAGSLPAAEEGVVVSPELQEHLRTWDRSRRRMPVAAQALPRCDVILFVATKTEEAALIFAAKELGLSFRLHQDPGDGQEYFDLGVLEKQRVLAARTEMGPFAHGGAASRAIQLRFATRATSLISVGMAFGCLPQGQRYGDILLSTGVIPYDERIVRDGPGHEFVHDYSPTRVFPPHPGELARFRAFSDRPEWHGKVCPGYLLTGGARIHSARFRDHLCQALADKGDLVVGGDMEGVGLLSASSTDAPCWMIVKAISDFADSRRDEVIKLTRPAACYSGAQFVLRTIAAGPG